MIGGLEYWRREGHDVEGAEGSGAISAETTAEIPEDRTLVVYCWGLIQPFLPHIHSHGEWSFVYFDDGSGSLRFSHAVVKRPAPGDFRVQSQRAMLRACITSYRTDDADLECLVAELDCVRRERSP
jgi:hypothetical protein